MVRVTCPGWYGMELPRKSSFLLSNCYHDHCKNVPYPFSQQQLSGKHIPSSKSFNLLVLYHSALVQHISPNYNCENGVKQIRLLQKICHNIFILSITSKGPSMRVKMHQIFLKFLPLFALCLLSGCDLTCLCDWTCLS